MTIRISYDGGMPPALHHAVWSGSLDTVKLLVEAGAKMDTGDSIYDGTPLDWAEYGKKEDIALYLKETRAMK